MTWTSLFCHQVVLMADTRSLLPTELDRRGLRVQRRSLSDNDEGECFVSTSDNLSNGYHYAQEKSNHRGCQLVSLDDSFHRWKHIGSCNALFEAVLGGGAWQIGKSFDGGSGEENKRAIASSVDTSGNCWLVVAKNGGSNH